MRRKVKVDERLARLSVLLFVLLKMPTNMQRNWGELAENFAPKNLATHKVRELTLSPRHIIEY
jgi:hypothetical protein